MEHHELDLRTVRAIASDGLPIFTVSAIPVAALVIAGYRIGRDAGLSGVKLILSVILTGLLGVAIAALKVALAH